MHSEGLSGRERCDEAERSEKILSNHIGFYLFAGYVDCDMCLKRGNNHFKVISSAILDVYNMPWWFHESIA